MSLALERRAKDERGQDEHWMYRLKYLNRRQPLNLKRLSPDLMIKIFSKQTGRTVINLSNISYKLYRLISRMLSQMKSFTLLERARQRYTLVKMLFGDFSNLKKVKLMGHRHAYSCEKSLGDRRTFYGWIEFILPKVNYEQLQKAHKRVGRELKAIYENRQVVCNMKKVMEIV